MLWTDRMVTGQTAIAINNVSSFLLFFLSLCQFLDGDLWDKIFKQKSLPVEEATLKPFTDSIVNDLNLLLDEGSI